MNVIVYGPQACGKTRNADKLAHYFGCEAIVDVDTQGRWTPPPSPPLQKFTLKDEVETKTVNTLFLTNEDRLLEDMQVIGDARCISFDEAMRLVNQPVRIPEFLRRSGSFGGAE